MENTNLTIGRRPVIMIGASKILICRLTVRPLDAVAGGRSPSTHAIA